MKTTAKTTLTSSARLTKDPKAALATSPKFAEIDFTDTNNEQLKRIQKIRQIGNFNSGRGAGIGFINFDTPEEKLVEYGFSGEEGLYLEEISLKQSLKWMKAIQFADIHYGTATKAEPYQDGDEGMTRWLDMIAAAVK